MAHLQPRTVRVGGPSVQDLTNAKCPDDKPYKCLPYGGCYGHDSYCDPKSQSVESCFSHYLTTIESKLAYCQDLSQNVSKIIRSECRFACMTISNQPAKSQVCESCPSVLIWQIAAIVPYILLTALVIYLCTQNRKWKKVYQKVTFQHQTTRAGDGAEEEEIIDLGIQPRDSNDEVVNVDNDMDVGGVPPTESQTQNQQTNLVLEILERTNDNPQLQQPSLTNRDSGEMPQDGSSGNVSSLLSSPSDSSVSTNDDSGISSGREALIDPVSLVQQSSQTRALSNQICGFNQQSQSEREADRIYVTSTTIPDQESRIVTSLTPYRD